MDSAKVYTVNGAAAGTSSAIPDWLTRKRASGKGKGKRGLREHIEGTTELIQGFEFPEASNKVKTTKDGHHVIATGTYKPQVRVWDLDQLSLKFERHTDAENVDFILLSDDWTKSIHLQNDRTVELHTQGGAHYRTRIPRFGRAIEYHYPSCDAYVAGAGNEVYRLNLDQGRFMTPLALVGESGDDIYGVNTIDVNPAHQLLAFGIEGNGTVQFWDPRSRSSVGYLHLPRSRLLPTGSTSIPTLPGIEGGSDVGLSVTAICSRADGLSYAVGTSTGHTLLYDIRSTKPYAMKDQGYGLPVKNVAWIEGGSRMAGDGMVLSADKKVIKIWDRNSPTSNFASITPATDLNHVHHVAGSGVLLQANEGIAMTTYYIPQLGPAPKWASFLENITEEMEDQTVRTIYEDYKFVERTELRTLGLEHLVGTPTLKPYMHGYFLALELYEAARLIASKGESYAEHREKMVKEKMDKLAETRIRSKKQPGVKVNKALAEKVLRDEEKAKKREERKLARRGEDMEVDPEKPVEGMDAGGAEKPSLLTDPRFSALFENPEFAVDEDTREYALMNPSAAAAKRNGTRGRTAVEDEEDESDKVSSDGLGGASDSEEEEESDSGNDSDDAGALSKFDRRVRPGQKNDAAQEAYSRNKERNRLANGNVNFVPMQARTDSTRRGVDTSASFGQRRQTDGAPARKPGSSSTPFQGGGAEVSWMPSASSRTDDDDLLVPGGGAGRKKSEKRKGVEEFGAGMEKGGEDPNSGVTENDRKGRSTRRMGVRSGSKNAFRKM